MRLMNSGSAKYVWGSAVGGLGGAAAGHMAVRLAYKLSEGAGSWFKGSHGPSFFDLLLSTAIFYAGVGTGLFPSGRRLRGAGLGFASAFALILAPMFLASRIFTWGENPADQPTYAWIYLMIVVYTAASIATVFLLGAMREEKLCWTSSLGALVGAFLGYLAGLGLFRLAPSLKSHFSYYGFWPPFGALLDGALSGACLAAGTMIAKDWTKSQQPQP